MVGHSAGGWLARAAMGDGVWSSTEKNGNADNGDDGSKGDDDVLVRTKDRIRCLVTIGAIHKVPETPSTCVTRGALKNTQEMYPDAFLRDEGIGYVSVGGNAIIGNDGTDPEPEEQTTTEADRLYAKRGERSASAVASTSYQAVCGTGNGITGDGVVPLEWTMLDGARKVELEGVLHSINEAGTTIPTDRWHGSDGVVDRWLDVVLEEGGIVAEKDGDGIGLGLDWKGVLEGVLESFR